MKRVIRETRTLRVPVKRRVHEDRELPSGGRSTSWSWVVDHYTDVDVELEIDVDALFHDVGTRAAANATGKAVEGGGAVTARRRSSRRVAS